MGGMFGAPRIPRGYLARPRLCAILDGDQALTVVHGPPGAGKTVAVADWAATAAGVWFTLSQASSTRDGFWGALSLKLVDAGLATEDSILGSGALGSLSTDPDPRRLVLRAFRQRTGELRIVIDDAQVVAVDPLIHEDLVALLEADARVSMVVIARARLFDSPKTRLALDPVFIGEDLLRFTPDEVTALLAAEGVADPDGTIADAVRAVEGTPALTRAIARAIAHGGDAFTPDRLARSVTELGARLLNELVREGQLSTEQQRAAMRCSVPERLTVSLVEELSGVDGADLLGALEAEGYGVWTDAPGAPAFTLSALVRSALRTELEEHAPGEVARLSRIAATWSSEHGYPSEGLLHAVAAGDLDLATEIAARHWPAFLYGLDSRVFAALNALPLRELAQHPELTMLLALAHNASSVSKGRALELLDIAGVAARRQQRSASPARRILLQLIESAAHRLVGNGDEALAAAVRVRATAGQLSRDDRDALGELFPTLLNQAGITFFHTGRPDAALEMLGAAVGLPSDARRRGNLHSVSLIAGIQAVQGMMSEAQRTVDLVTAGGWPPDLVDGYPGCMFHVARAWLLLERGEFAAARDEVAIMDPHFATIEHWPLLAHLHAMAMLGLGEPRAALAHFEAAMRSHSSVARPMQLRLAATHAVLHLAVGAPGAAERVLEEHSPRLLPIAVGRARLELLRGRPEEVARLLLAVEPSPGDAVRWQTEAHLLRAGAAMRLGAVDAALAEADTAAALMHRHGLRMPLRLIPAPDADAVRGALERRGASLATEQFGHRDEVPSLLPDAVPAVTLSERELVVLRALAALGSIAAVADALFVSKNTVKSQLRSAYQKLGVSTRSEAILAASELNLLS